MSAAFRMTFLQPPSGLKMKSDPLNSAFTAFLRLPANYKQKILHLHQQPPRLSNRSMSLLSHQGLSPIAEVNLTAWCDGYIDTKANQNLFRFHIQQAAHHPAGLRFCHITVCQP